LRDGDGTWHALGHVRVDQAGCGVGQREQSRVEVRTEGQGLTVDSDDGDTIPLETKAPLTDESVHRGPEDGSGLPPRTGGVRSGIVQFECECECECASTHLVAKYPATGLKSCPVAALVISQIWSANPREPPAELVMAKTRRGDLDRLRKGTNALIAL
jgi:hypothetical protein